MSDPKYITETKIETHCPSCGCGITAYAGWRDYRNAPDVIVRATHQDPWPRQWTLRSFGGTVFAEGNAMPTGEVVHVREVIPVKK